jgi:hypothetical protein
MDLWRLPHAGPIAVRLFNEMTPATFLPGRPT